MIETLVHWLKLGGGLILVVFLANFSESSVIEYTLPSIFDNPTTTVEEWEEVCRGEIISLFEENVYGAIPKEKPSVSVELLEEGDAFNDLAYRKQFKLTLSRSGVDLPLQLLVYVPKGDGVHKTILSYNFEGNHTMNKDADIIPSVVYAKRLPGVLKSFKESQRGRWSERLPIERLIEKGYAVVTLYYGDVDPDYDDGFKNGAHALYPEIEKESWGSVSAWAWGFIQVMNYVEANPALDEKHVALFGFSRLGKAALWAAANDGRFSSTVIDSSGEGGAALARRNFGETIKLMTLRFPHWFTKNYASYAGRENELPVDQHMLLALIAPRPLLISSGDKDEWSDPKGEKLAVEAAQETYNLYNSDNLQYTLHQGKHEVVMNEWNEYISFLDNRLK